MRPLSVFTHHDYFLKDIGYIHAHHQNNLALLFRLDHSSFPRLSISYVTQLHFMTELISKLELRIRLLEDSAAVQGEARGGDVQFSGLNHSQNSLYGKPEKRRRKSF